MSQVRAHKGLQLTTDMWASRNPVPFWRRACCGMAFDGERCLLQLKPDPLGRLVVVEYRDLTSGRSFDA